MKRKFFVIEALTALAATSLRAQGGWEIIAGVVKDASGAVVPLYW